MNIIMFMDDQNLNVCQNFKRYQPEPQLIGEPYIDPSIVLVNLAWAYPFVFFCPEINKWVMLYQGWSRDKKIVDTSLSLSAYSDDGYHFKPLDMNHYNLLSSRILPNQVLPYQIEDGIITETQFFYLDKLSGSHKFIALCLLKTIQNTFKAITFHSINGLNWELVEGSFWHTGEDAPDFPLSIYYHEKNQSYIVTKRPKHTDRRISISFSKDFKTFTPSEIIMQPDALDLPLTDMYGMLGFSYYDQYIGLIMLYHTPNYMKMNNHKVSGLNTHKFYGGKVDCQLVYSENGKFFNRFLRTPFLGGVESLYKCIYPTCLIKKDEGLYIYASATSEEHGYINEAKGCIICYKVRVDGFSTLQSLPGNGYLCSKAFYYEGGEITFNLKCLNGECKLQISQPNGEPYKGFSFTDCIVFIGDSTEYRFSFANHSLTELVGKIIVFELLMQYGEIYSIKGNLNRLTPYEVFQMEKKVK